MSKEEKQQTPDCMLFPQSSCVVYLLAYQAKLEKMRKAKVPKSEIRKIIISRDSEAELLYMWGKTYDLSLPKRKDGWSFTDKDIQAIAKAHVSWMVQHPEKKAELVQVPIDQIKTRPNDDDEDDEDDDFKASFGKRF